MNALIPKNPRITDPDHLALIRDMSCIVCYAPPPSDAAHLRMGLAAGMGMKSHDRWSLPLCRRCHARQHQEGEAAFWLDVLGTKKHLLVSVMRAFAEAIHRGNHGR